MCHGNMAASQLGEAFCSSCRQAVCRQARCRNTAIDLSPLEDKILVSNKNRWVLWRFTADTSESLYWDEKHAPVLNVFKPVWLWPANQMMTGSLLQQLQARQPVVWHKELACSAWICPLCLWASRYFWSTLPHTACQHIPFQFLVSCWWVDVRLFCLAGSSSLFLSVTFTFAEELQLWLADGNLVQGCNPLGCLWSRQHADLQTCPIVPGHKLEKQACRRPQLTSFGYQIHNSYKRKMGNELLLDRTDNYVPGLAAGFA